MGKIVKLLAKYYPVYLSGLWGTLWISAVTVLLGLVLGMLVALMRMSRSKLLNAVSGVYIEVLRGTPMHCVSLSSKGTSFGSPIQKK